MAKFFERDPKIEWMKVFCPICSQPTGPTSNCENLDVNEVPQHKRFMLQGEKVLPIFSKSCMYKRENLWLANLNYPASELLRNTLLSLKGIDSITAVKPHTFQASIGAMFDEREVKLEITKAYKTFIKELQVEEGAVKIDGPLWTGITMPNGTELVAKPDSLDEQLRQSAIFADIAEQIPGCRAIKIIPST